MQRKRFFKGSHLGSMSVRLITAARSSMLLSSAAGTICMNDDKFRKNPEKTNDSLCGKF
jgi:hypothetical protein